MLRVANSGISAIIGPAGRISASTHLLRKDICVGSFDFISYQSFYTRHGDLVAILCAIICVLALAWSCVRNRVSGVKPGLG